MPLALAEAISGLEAVPALDDWVDAFLAGALLLVEELVAAAPGAELAAGAEVSAGAAEADFLLLFFGVAVSDMVDELAGAAVDVAVSLLVDFLLLLFFFPLDVCLPAVDEASALTESELIAASDFALFLDFLLDVGVLLEAAD